MDIQEIKIKFETYTSAEALTVDQHQLLQAAHQACEQAYAPYSQFFVGAAARLADGTIVKGANQENAAYPMCLCAERVVLAAVAANHPDQQVTALAVTVHNPRQTIDRPGAPCGACRQVISEREDQQKAPIQLILQGESGPVFAFSSGKDLLPLAFGGDML